MKIPSSAMPRMVSMECQRFSGASGDNPEGVAILISSLAQFYQLILTLIVFNPENLIILSQKNL
ncbi:hypothetical protein JOD17_002205 [Geomicrobium sediminis]|uniref:Uncharacterized protein n=1 Tax=Geomicrobium sediminis TaxID=1347788 RepID=A0ABS2PDQ5_9BACL|nr:hypothetical protein [Geomicrobium sediminis]